MKKALLFLLTVLFYISAFSQKVLIIDAHPDDESGCAATVYKITQELGGVVDLAIVTNGEAGYKYSLLAEKIYGQKLTIPEIGRKYLPNIRKKELRKGCNWVGIRHIFHYNQLDTHYTLDPDTVMKSVWEVAKVRKSLSQKIEKEQYDYIFCLLPTLETHGHHKAATIIALETVQNLNGKKPVILAVSVGMKSDTTEKVFTGLSNYPLTAISKGHHTFMMDRTASFGHKDKLNYKLVVNWLIAEHKSQGTMQTFMNQGDYEYFWWFDINDKANFQKTQELFDKLAKSRPNSLPMIH